MTVVAKSAKIVLGLNGIWIIIFNYSSVEFQILRNCTSYYLRSALLDLPFLEMLTNHLLAGIKSP